MQKDCLTTLVLCDKELLPETYEAQIAEVSVQEGKKGQKPLVVLIVGSGHNSPTYSALKDALRVQNKELLDNLLTLDYAALESKLCLKENQKYYDHPKHNWKKFRDIKVRTLKNT